MPPKKQFEERFLVPLTTEMLAEIDKYLKPSESRAQLVRDGIEKELEYRRSTMKSEEDRKKDYIFEWYLKDTEDTKMTPEEWFNSKSFRHPFTLEEVQSIDELVRAFDRRVDMMRIRYARELIADMSLNRP